MGDDRMVLDPEQQRFHKEALERWVLAEREIQLFNTACRTFAEDNLSMPDPGWRTVTMPREAVVRFRASYELAIAALASLLGKAPQEMTQFDAVAELIRRHYDAAYPKEEVTCP